MQNAVFEKTDKGREEISTRKYQLASRLRSLLVMVDGKQTMSELLTKVVQLGLDEQSISELLEKEFIRVRAD